MFTEVINQTRSSGFFLIGLHSIRRDSETSGVSPCWPLETMQLLLCLNWPQFSDPEVPTTIVYSMCYRHAHSPHCFSLSPGRPPAGWLQIPVWLAASHGQRAPSARSLLNIQAPWTPRRHSQLLLVRRLPFQPPHLGLPKGESCHWKQWITCHVKPRCWPEIVWSRAAADGRPGRSQLSVGHQKNRGLQRCSEGSQLVPQPVGSQEKTKGNVKYQCIVQ